MSEFNQAKFESVAKKLVAFSYEVDVDDKDVYIVWFSKVGANAKAMLVTDLDHRYFKVTYFGEEGKYIVASYDLTGLDEIHEEESKDTSTPQVQIEDDKVTASVKTKCHVCQEHHQILGMTDAFDLQIKEDILILTVRALYSDKRFWKDAFKIKYCPFCGRKL